MLQILYTIALLFNQATCFRFSLTECGPNEFECEDGTCIDQDQQCDGVPHCRRGEDEQDCETTECDESREFLCRADNTCIQKDTVCDGRNDCSDGEDEICEGKSKPNALIKRLTALTVVPITHTSTHTDVLMIMITDMIDGQQKRTKRITYPYITSGKGGKANFCPLGKFTCGDRSCVSILGRCDGKVDCPRDHADEDECPCPRKTWQCDYGQCIPLEQKCDGNIDCPDDISDERNCPRCSPHEFQCRWDRRCIPIEKKCDKVFDCRDRTDEQVCGKCIPGAALRFLLSRCRSSILAVRCKRSSLSSCLFWIYCL
uniref:Uncharacterized protein n=1 Tax=Anopheles stephensi TaxID=30069 RepID=A0A182YG32_ANOST